MNNRLGRKTIVYESHFRFKDVTFIVNSGEGKGIIKEILEKLIEQLQISYEIHRRLHVLRFDLHQVNYSDDNQTTSRFFNLMNQWLRRNYQMKEVGYGWVREQSKAKSQHYHCAYYLDGDKIRFPDRLIRKMKDVWVHGNVSYVKKPYFNINHSNYETEMQNAIYRISYLAKSKTKGYRKPQTKDYSFSRLVNSRKTI